MQQAQGSNQPPSQTLVNAKGVNVNGIFLRSRKSFEPSLVQKNNKVVEPISKPGSDVIVETEKEQEKEYVPPIPFP